MNKSKLVNYLSLTILLIFLVVFTLSIAFEKEANQSFYLFITATVVLSYGAIRASDGLQDEIILIKNFYPEILSLVISTLATYYLAFITHDAVIAASVIGILYYFIMNKLERKDLAAPGYCGTFVGMSSQIILPNIWYVLIAGLITGFIYVLSRNNLKGVGGKLGLIAFVGVSFSIFLTEIFS